MFGLEGMFGKKTLPAEEGQADARNNENGWAAMVAGQKSAEPKMTPGGTVEPVGIPQEPKMTPEGRIEPEGISDESKELGYEGKTPFKSELTTEQVPVIDESAEAEEGEFLTPFQKEQRMKELKDSMQEGEGDGRMAA